MPHSPELSTAHWRSSSHSNSNGGECVEISDDFPGIVPVRDSKNPAGPALVVRATAWSDFVTSLK
ncbi:DUF397 domain-containing protein [Streptomyces sp. NBC_00876]|uniref:DUF397 domain-containing protein n=1 Tax=Streptomyces sp. NBC_00876 TaxID=2975853 RepID=UPI00386A30C5|nr:DUF397 domain-containing protein [Streptomyces sp. NBC_00876]